jgi:hypothetical protein
MKATFVGLEAEKDIARACKSVRSFLRSCGLVNIRLVAETVAISGVSRCLFSAEPSQR